MDSEEPSPALLAARERSRVAEDRLRQHLLGGGSTGSFKQSQPAEIVQSISPQTYQVSGFNPARDLCPALGRAQEVLGAS